jgi:drug/metabolite transporter (DMT)-like permease
VLGIIGLNGLLAMVLGMTIFLFALRHGNVTLVAIMSSTSPVMLLPILWLFTRQRPSLGSWLGAILVVCGTGLVLAR